MMCLVLNCDLYIDTLEPKQIVSIDYACQLDLEEYYYYYYISTAMCDVRDNTLNQRWEASEVGGCQWPWNMLTVGGLRLGAVSGRGKC